MIPKVKPISSRKRIRKRKRRNVSISSSSAVSSDSSEPSDSESLANLETALKSSSPALSEISDSESDSDSESSIGQKTNETNTKLTTEDPLSANNDTKEYSVQKNNSPILKPTPGPTLIGSTNEEAEKQLKKRFREFWMAAIADGFADDLDGIRKESNMSDSRLASLIESLASGADIFSSHTSPDGDVVNEMELILDD